MDPALIFTFIILFLLSAFFSASEIALMSIANHKLDSLLKQNKFWSKDLKYIKDKNDRLLITILIWNNLVNVYIAALATQIAISLASSYSLEQSLAIWLSTWIITFMLLMFWEIVPKSFATKNSESISLWIAKFYKWIMIIFTPILFIIEIIIKVITWKWEIPKITEEEIESFIDMWKTSWTLEAWEHEKIKNMLEFSDITVEEIITPRVKIDALPIDTTIDDALDFVLSHTHSRIPIYNETIDNITHVVNIRFLLSESRKWNWNVILKDLKNLDKAIKIPVNHPIDKLLDIFKNSRKHLAIVIDEYGWVAWLVTLEDIIEEVFWDIRDEYDKEKDEIVKIGDNKYEVQSSMIFEDLIDYLWLKFENLWLDDKEYYATTISYYITEELERFPTPWEIIEKKIFWEWYDLNNIEYYLIFKIITVIGSKIENVEVSIEERLLNY